MRARETKKREKKADLAVDHDVGRVVVKDGGDVLAGEGIRRVADQQAGLADSAVTNHHALDRLHFNKQICVG